MKTSVLLLHFFLITNLAIAQSSVENIIFDCVAYRYDSLGISIIDELDIYERYLIEYNYLTDTTVQGYHKLFTSVFNNASGDLPEYMDYKINCMDIYSYDIFNDCIKQYIHNLSDSAQIRYMYQEISDIQQQSNVAVRDIMSLLTNALSVEKFKSRLEKYYVLYNYYFLTSSHIYPANDSIQLILPKTDTENLNRIIITIASKDDIYLNDVKIDSETIQENVLKYCRNISLEIQDLTVIISVSPDLKVKCLTDTMNILQESGVEKIQLSTL